MKMIVLTLNFLMMIMMMFLLKIKCMRIIMHLWEIRVLRMEPLVHKLERTLKIYLDILMRVSATQMS